MVFLKLKVLKNTWCSLYLFLRRKGNITAEQQTTFYVRISTITVWQWVALLGSYLIKNDWVSHLLKGKVWCSKAFSWIFRSTWRADTPGCHSIYFLYLLTSWHFIWTHLIVSFVWSLASSQCHSALKRLTKELFFHIVNANLQYNWLLFNIS